MALFLSFALLGFGKPADQAHVAPPPRARSITNTSTFYGEVLAVDAKSINIRGHEQGLQMEKFVRHFPAGSALRKGEQEPLERTSWDYRLSDVKVGDLVYIVVHIYGEDHLCVAVRIKRRPGGAVPKAPFEDADARNPYHEMMNAYQQFEEKGIPLPLKYDLNYQRALSEAKARYREELLDQFRRAHRMQDEGRIAPPPRLVVPEIKFPLAPLVNRGPTA